MEEVIINSIYFFIIVHIRVPSEPLIRTDNQEVTEQVSIGFTLHSFMNLPEYQYLSVQCL